MKRILLVESDATQGEVFRNALAAESGEWEVVRVPDGTEAQATLAAQPCDAVLVSEVLTGSRGIDLLDEVSRQHPRTVRFLLADQVGHDVIMRCVWAMHQCIARSGDAVALVGAVRRALSADSWLTSEKLKSLVARMRTLPTLPSVYQEVVKVLNSPNASAEEVANLIGKDLAMTAKLLQTVNSAFFGLPQPVTTPSEAVLHLGLETVHSLVLSVHTFAQLDKVKPLYFTADKVWRHSMRVGALAKQIVLLETDDSSMAADAYTAGLFHDMGKLLLATNLPEEYNGAQSLAVKRGIPLAEVEQEIFGATHAEVAAYMLGLWGLSPGVVEAVARHHSPRGAGEKKFTALTALHAANGLDYLQTPENDGFKAPQLDAVYFESLDVAARVPEWQKLAAGQRATKPTPKVSEPVEEKVIAIAPALEGVSTATESRRFNYLPWAIGTAIAASVAFAAVLLPDRAKARVDKPVAAPTATESTKVEAIEPSLPMSTAQSVEPQQTVDPVPAVAEAKPAAEPIVRVTQIPAAPTYKLQGIFYTASNPSAVIDGKTLSRGDTIRGAKVIAIERGSVALEVDGTTRILRLR